MSDTENISDTPARRTAWQWIRTFLNGWTIGGIVLAAVVIFYSDNDVFQSIEDEQMLDSLRLELQANRDTTEYYRTLNRRLESDPALMEQVVREQYGMKRATEDAYTFIENE